MIDISVLTSPTMIARSAGIFLAILGLASVWVFPFSGGPSPDALQQIYAAVILSVTALIFGFDGLSRKLLLLWAGALLLVAVATGTYWENKIFGVVAVLIAGIGCHLGVRLQRNSNLLVYLISAILFAAVVNAAEGLLQWFGLVSSLVPWVIEPERRGIAFGAFRQLNLFATFLSVGTICAIWLVQLRKLSEPMAWFLVSILVAGVAASGSRAGGLELIALALVALVYWRQQEPEVTRLMIGQFALFLGATLLLPLAAELHGFEFVTSLSRVGQSSQYSRLALWSNVIDMISAKPLTGWGWSEIGYAHYLTDFEIRFGEKVGHAHNLPLQIAVELGVPAAIILGAVAVWAVYAGRPLRVAEEKAFPSQSRLENRSFAWAILLIIVGVHSMLEYPLWYASFVFLTGFAIGYLQSPRFGADSESKHLKWSLWSAYLAVWVVVTLSAIGAYQYTKVFQISKVPFNDGAALKKAIANAAGSWMFQGILDYAELSLIEMNAGNAADIKGRTQRLLHYSVDPPLIRALIQSHWYLGEFDAMRYHANLFCRAYPLEYSKWQQATAAQAMANDLGQPSVPCMAPQSMK